MCQNVRCNLINVSSGWRIVHDRLYVLYDSYNDLDRERYKWICYCCFEPRLTKSVCSIHRRCFFWHWGFSSTFRSFWCVPHEIHEHLLHLLIWTYWNTAIYCSFNCINSIPDALLIARKSGQKFLHRDAHYSLRYIKWLLANSVELN